MLVFVLENPYEYKGLNYIIIITVAFSVFRLQIHTSSKYIHMAVQHSVISVVHYCMAFFIKDLSVMVGISPTVNFLKLKHFTLSVLDQNFGFIRAEIHKMLSRIANREDHVDQAV